jgi:hypothetical protein
VLSAPGDSKDCFTLRWRKVQYGSKQVGDVINGLGHTWVTRQLANPPALPS